MVWVLRPGVQLLQDAGAIACLGTSFGTRCFARTASSSHKGFRVLGFRVVRIIRFSGDVGDHKGF